MVRTSVLVAGVMGAVAASAHAGLTSGAFAFFTGVANTSDYDLGTVPATYSASVTNESPESTASATLVWGASSYSFTGTASGDSDSTIFAYSNGVASFTFVEAMNVTMSWNLASVAGKSSDPGSLAGWTIENATTSATVYGIQFTDSATTPFSIAGGITASNIASGVTGQVAAGTYRIATAVQVDVPTSGTFSVTISFTPVPAPGALPLVAIASIVARRGRRR
jgi:hypothetical protein